MSGFSVAMAACYLNPGLPRKSKVVSKTTIYKTRTLVTRAKSWLERKKESKRLNESSDNDSYVEVGVEKAQKNSKELKLVKKRPTRSEKRNKSTKGRKVKHNRDSNAQ